MVILGGLKTSEQLMLRKCPNILICFNTELSEQEQVYLQLPQWDT